MLTFDQEQWRELQANDAYQFVVAVRDQFISNRPDLTIQPGADAVLDRMQAAHDYAARIGFISNSHIVYLMYMAGDVPHFYDDPQTDFYLRKPGATPEQRLDDLIAVIKIMLKESR
jgi:hypothetical protein